MKDLTKLQDEIEARARRRLNKDINELNTKYRELLNSYPIVSNIAIKIQGADDQTLSPFISQLLSNEIVLAKIADKNLPAYVDAEIAKILER